MPNLQDCLFECDLPQSRDRVFELLIDRPESWWLPVFDDQFETVGIDPCPGGACYESAVDGHQKAWGTVLSIEPPLYIRMAWQVSSFGEPLADPAAASRVMISLRQVEERTRLELLHSDFIRHGDDAAAVRELMCSEQGWPARLKLLVSACR